MALVYVAVVGPSLCLKTSAPYWFDFVSYRTRMIAAAVCMAAAFGLVGITQSLGLQLLGVAMASVQNGIGEASMLALASRYSLNTSSESDDDEHILIQRVSNDLKTDSQGITDSSGEDNDVKVGSFKPGAATLTAWSSGTGFAGVFGYGWITVLHVWVGLSFCATILLAWSLVIAWLVVFFYLLPAPPPFSSTSGGLTSKKQGVAVADLTMESPLSPELESPESGIDTICSTYPSSMPSDTSQCILGSPQDDRAAGISVEDFGGDDDDGEETVPVKLEMTFKERLAFVASLWPFMVDKDKKNR